MTKEPTINIAAGDLLGPVALSSRVVEGKTEGAGHLNGATCHAHSIVTAAVRGGLKGREEAVLVGAFGGRPCGLYKRQHHL